MRITFCKYFIVILLITINTSSLASDQESFQQEIKPLLEKYCYKCHDEDVQKGDFRLDTYTDVKQILPNRKHWLKVLEQLETQEMPTKKPLPTADEYEKLVHWVEKAVNDIDWEKVKHPGHVTIPLLTNEEYFNTIEDITGLNMKPFSKFSNDSEGVSGFTNDRDGLFLSTTKMEKYLESAETIIDSFFAVQQAPETWKLESEKMFMTETSMKPQTKGDFTGYFLNRGQMSLYESIDIPADGLYEIKARIAPEKGSVAATALRVNNNLKLSLETYSKEPQVKKELIFLTRGTHQFTWNIAETKKDLKLKAMGTLLTKEQKNQVISNARNFIWKIPEIDHKNDKKMVEFIEHFARTMRQLQKALEEVKLYGKDGFKPGIAQNLQIVNRHFNHITSSLKKFEQKTKQPLLAEFNKINARNLAEKDRVLEIFANVELPKGAQSVGIDWMSVTGPLRPKNSLLISPTSDNEVKNFLESWLSQVFRKPVDESDLNQYYSLYTSGIARGENLQDSLKLAMVTTLISPKFLFRDELTPDVEAFELNEYQLASRLSYFLWLSTPDEELLTLAKEGTLKANLDQQINRMLMSSKSQRFIESFTSEWLGYKSLGKTIKPDAKVFPHYSEEVNEAAKMEIILMTKDLFQQDKSLLHFIDSPHTYVNESLARLYDLEDIKGEHFRSVELNNPQRGGLMGMAAILTSTSNPGRTNPVNRGLFIFEKLLGQHMAMPPADVPPLPENAGSQKGMTLREEFEKHRENAACSNCHNKIDPLGFGLENFDAIGRFRDTDNGQKIDASGVMPDGHKFNGIAELKKYILKEKQQQFLRNITQRLLSFALGRELQYFDEPVIKKIMAATEKNNFSSQTLLKEVIRSYPFNNQSNSTEILGDIK